MFAKKKSAPICPFIKGECLGDGCMLWTHVRGTSPQGGEVDMHDCTFRWLPMLLIENSKVERETGAAVESFRNEVVKANSITLALQVEARNRGINKSLTVVSD